ncbi:hypothetical protein ACFW93_09600 [Streptomyces canus]|uniref:hypothetical protein n=1 Tax=Streptomyces canus TaxID=58343 RepID=UPI00368B8659
MPDVTLYVRPDGTATTVTVVETLAACRPGAVTASEPGAACAETAEATSGTSAATPTKASDLRRTIFN